MPASTSRPVSHEPWRLAALWAGLLAGPVAWLLLLEFNYVAAYVACETSRTWFMHAAVMVAAAGVGVAAFAAWRGRFGSLHLKDEPAPPLSDQTRIQRSQWMSVAGIGMSLFFVIVILTMEIPIIVLKECQ
jgi:H+/Cl- antiporter ClcA